MSIGLYSKHQVEVGYGCFRKLVGFPPKSSILIGFSIKNHPFWDTPILGNTHMLFWVEDHDSWLLFFALNQQKPLENDGAKITYSFGDGLVPGAMLNFRGVISSCWKLKSNVTITSDLLPICANSMGRKVLDMGVSSNGGTTKHPKMIMFSRNTHGCWVPPC